MDTHNHADREARVPLTPEMSAALKAEAARTGVGPHVLAKDYLDVGGGISGLTVYRWMTAAVKSVAPGPYEAVLKSWRRLPDLSSGHAVSTPAIRARMRAHRSRTGVGIVRLLAGREDWPEGLRVSAMENFYRGRTATVPLAHVDYIIKLWSELPEVKRVSLTPEIVAELRDHIERTGKGPSAILRGAKNKPEGLKAAVIARWLNGGIAARKDHLDYVRARYRPASHF